MPVAPFYINQDNAKLLAAKSHEARRQNALTLSIPAPTLQQAKQIADEYTARRISVTRKQIRLLDDQLASCRIPKDLKAIADAIYRLSDLERQLSGRPLPGTLKPERAVKRAVVWSEPEPVATPQQVATCVCDDPSI